MKQRALLRKVSSVNTLTGNATSIKPKLERLKLEDLPKAKPAKQNQKNQARPAKPKRHFKPKNKKPNKE